MLLEYIYSILLGYYFSHYNLKGKDCLLIVSLLLLNMDISGALHCTWESLWNT